MGNTSPHFHSRLLYQRAKASNLFDVCDSSAAGDGCVVSAALLHDSVAAAAPQADENTSIGGR